MAADARPATAASGSERLPPRTDAVHRGETQRVVAHLGALLGLIVSAAAQSNAPAALPPLASPVDRCAQLLSATAAGDSRSDPAWRELIGLIGDKAALSALQSSKPAIISAIENARAGAPPKPNHWFEPAVGELLHQLGEEERAAKGLETYYAAAKPPAGEPVLQWNYAGGMRLLAELQRARGQQDLARRTAEKARAAAEPAADAGPLRDWLRAVQADTWGVEARCCLDLYLLQDAWRALQPAMRIVEELPPAGHQATRRRIGLNLAEYHIQQDCYDAALQVLADLGNENDDINAFRLTVELYRAEASGNESADLAERMEAMLSNASLGRSTITQARLILLRRAIDLHRIAEARRQLDALRTLTTDSDGPLAAELTTLETRLMLAEPHPDRAALRMQLALHRRAFAQLLDWWRRIEASPGGAGFLARAGRRRNLTELVRLVRHLDGAAAAGRCARDGLLRMQELTSLARLLEAKATTAAEVEAAFVGPQRGVAALLTEPAQSLLLVWDAQGPTAVELPGSRELAPLVQALTLAIADATMDDDASHRAAHCARVQQKSKELSAMLLPPAVQQRLAEWREATVADYGGLDGIPWECLPLGNAMLGEVVAVSNLTSLPLGVHLMNQAAPPVPRATARLTLVATLAGSRSLLDAKSKTTNENIDRIAQTFLQHYRVHDELLGRDATLAAIARLGLDGPVTHLFCHGAERSPTEPPGLAMTPAGDEDDGFYGCTLAGQRQVRGTFILSSCGTGRTLRRIGDEPMAGTLGGALFLAGANVVIQSGAELHIGAHVKLMDAMHARMIDGVAPASAMQAARAQRALDADWLERLENARVQVYGIGHRAVFAR